MPKRIFDKEFKLNAVKLVTEQRLTITRASKDLGIGLSTLQRWVRELTQQGAVNVFPGSGSLSADQARLKKLERDNDILRREREILKKALAIFSLP